MKVILDLYNLNLLIRISTSSCRQRHLPHSLEVFLREKLYPILTNLFSGEQSKTLKPHCVFAMLQSPPIVQSAIDEITKKIHGIHFAIQQEKRQQQGCICPNLLLFPQEPIFAIQGFTIQSAPLQQSGQQTLGQRRCKNQIFFHSFILRRLFSN